MTRWDPRAVIAAKRDGGTLAPEQIERFVLAYARGELGDGPAAAFLMAALLNGLDDGETLAMTEAMIASGETVAFGDLGRPSVDKHSTGGVADGVTLVFAPLTAALGLAVAKLSGRGLGHTGGTLDKLEAIPGFRTDLSPAEIAQQVRAVGCAVAAQSPALVPADGALYALRDATATVESIPLIAASVMSKKLAVATDLILLDVKAGSGAFMRTPDEARSLASACLALARGAERPAAAAVTDMSQPLGDAVGNALDIAETVAILRGEQRGRLRELAVWFTARAVERLEGGSFEDALARAGAALDDGSALDRFRRMVQAQGGDPRVVDDPVGVLPRAPVVVPLLADRAGIVSAVATDRIGVASGALGAGRLRKGDPIDPAVGIVMRPKIGDRVEVGETLGEVHARTDEDADEAIIDALAALMLVEHEVEPPPLVHDWLPG
ncbi:MAG TPA: thymidine phosphorylase [Actinomycetota bacterium]|nr:thymidine phosphorylase [Actinomycetota bacterium]